MKSPLLFEDLHLVFKNHNTETAIVIDNRKKLNNLTPSALGWLTRLGFLYI